MTMTIKYRPRCFLDVEIDGEPAGRIIIELYSDVCPKTAENFRALCTGEKLLEKSEKSLHYRGAPFHRIVKDFMIQSGDFENGNGTGGESIYGGFFPDENFNVKHDKKGLLAMANRGKDTNGSQFFITTKPAPHLDGCHVVFGEVLNGFEVVQKIEMQETNNENRPVSNVRISNCGELVLQVRPKMKEKAKKKTVASDDSTSSGSSDSDSDSSDSSGSTSSTSSSSSSSDSDAVKSKSRKEKKKDTKAKSKNDENAKDTETEVKEKDEPNFYSTVKPDEVPPVPQNKFLFRASSPKKEEQERKTKSPPPSLADKRGPRRVPYERQSTSRSGRKIKGRGAVRYHSRSRSRSRSETPPHWRREQDKLKPLSKVLEEVSKAKWSRGEQMKDTGKAIKGDSKESKDREQGRSRRTEKDLGEKLKSANSLSDRFQSRGELTEFESSKEHSETRKDGRGKRAIEDEGKPGRSKRGEAGDGADSSVEKDLREKLKNKEQRRVTAYKDSDTKEKARDKSSEPSDRRSTRQEEMKKTVGRERQKRESSSSESSSSSSSSEDEAIHRKVQSRIQPSVCQSRAEIASDSGKLKNVVAEKKHWRSSDSDSSSDSDANKTKELERKAVILKDSEKQYSEKQLSINEKDKKEKSTDCDSALIPLLCVHG